MKIRNGYVSNSSSSSFIVIWEKEPTSVEEVKEVLFPGLDTKHTDYYGNHDTYVLAKRIFNETKPTTNEEIKSEIRDQYSYYQTWYDKGYKADEELCEKYENQYREALKEEKTLEELEKKYSNQEKNRILRKIKLERILDESSLDEYETAYLNLQKRLEIVREITWGTGGYMKELVEDSYNKFMSDFDGKFVAIYEFGDDNGDGALEHGGIFDNLEHIRTSHH